jgi:predicted nuclease with TOPRIM domain
METRLDRIDKRLERVNTRFEQMNTRLVRNDMRFDRSNVVHRALESRQDDLEMKLDSLLEVMLAVLSKEDMGCECDPFDDEEWARFAEMDVEEVEEENS